MLQYAFRIGYLVSHSAYPTPAMGHFKGERRTSSRHSFIGVSTPGRSKIGNEGDSVGGTRASISPASFPDVTCVLMLDENGRER